MSFNSSILPTATISGSLIILIMAGTVLPLAFNVKILPLCNIIWRADCLLLPLTVHSVHGDCYQQRKSFISLAAICLQAQTCTQISRTASQVPLIVLLLMMLLHLLLGAQCVHTCILFLALHSSSSQSQSQSVSRHLVMLSVHILRL